jgi:hypothetical protein
MSRYILGNHLRKYILRTFSQLVTADTRILSLSVSPADGHVIEKLLSRGIDRSGMKR